MSELYEIITTPKYTSDKYEQEEEKQYILLEEDILSFLQEHLKMNFIVSLRRIGELYSKNDGEISNFDPETLEKWRNQLRTTFLKHE